ncbi:DUF2252 domain-containing protein [Candidatus Binatia bacterium]|nr:DUF2252 domain-containing protein [Candidatus Binatia bacterium]
MTETRRDRIERGRALRESVPRSAHGEWQPSQSRKDPIAVLERQAKSRVKELVPVRYARMAESPFAFFRGAAAVMAMDLAATPATGLRVQACGDAHVNNFGKFATPERNLLFDINDFDETLPGPWEWDVKRLCTSLAIVARQRGFRVEEGERVIEAAARTYREHMADYARMRMLEVWYDRIAVEDVIAHFPARYRGAVRRDVERAQKRDHRRAVAKLTKPVDGESRFVEDPPLVVHVDRAGHGKDVVDAMLEDYRRSLAVERRVLLDRYTLVDVARRVVGVGSVGTRCWLALFEGPFHPDGDPLVLQIKEAQPSVLEPYVGACGFEHGGLRVVAGQRMIQAASDLFLGWCTAPSGRKYYVRQMWDVKGQSDPMTMTPSGLGYYGALCAWTLARAHARTGDAAAIAGYLGKSNRFDRAIVEFSARYAEVNEKDHAALCAAIRDGRVQAA